VTGGLFNIFNKNMTLPGHPAFSCPVRDSKITDPDHQGSISAPFLPSLGVLKSIEA